MQKAVFQHIFLKHQTYCIQNLITFANQKSLSLRFGGFNNLGGQLRRKGE